MSSVITAIKGKRIHQILPNLSYGDAISNYVIAIRGYLRSQGAESSIYVLNADDLVAGEGILFHKRKPQSQDILFYHHAIGSELTAWVAAHPGPKALIYHNITPYELYAPYFPDFANKLLAGRKELQAAAGDFQNALGVSDYNCRELGEYGFNEPRRLPLIIDPETFMSGAVDNDFLAKLRDGKKNILFTGRVAPHKCQTDLLEAFSWLRLVEPDVRLLIVGGHGEDLDPYYEEIKEKIRDFGLENHVLVTGKVSDEKFKACFAAADLYWSMSEHEGFGVPLIEAMWFDIPVFAYNSSAISETLGSAAFMFNDKNNMPALAATARILLNDETLRRKIIAAQQLRRRDFLPEKVYPYLEREVLRLVNSQ